MLEDRRLLAFGTEGLVTTDFLASQGDWIESIVLQPDGKIVAGGNSGLARYNPDGTLDELGFNAGGIQPGTIGGVNYRHYFNDVSLQADGKIVAGGMKLGAYDLDFLVSRYTPAGSPDPTFGVNGEVTLAFQGGTNGTTDEIEALATQSDGKIVAVGRASNWSKREWVVMRFLPDGRLDPSFDRDGILTTTFGGKTSAPQPYAVVMQSDGKILVAGTVGHSGTATRDDFALVRYNATGSLDQTFGQGGKVLTDFGSEHGKTYSYDEARSITLQPDGKIVVGGSSRYIDVRFALARYNANGFLDTTFGGDGRVSLGGSRYESVTVQADGKIVAGGGVLIDRFNLNGSPDTSFGLDGRASLYSDANPYLNQVRDIVIQPQDGKILVAGSSDSYGDTRFALARLNPVGSFDTGLDPASVDFLMSPDRTKRR